MKTISLILPAVVLPMVWASVPAAAADTTPEQLIREAKAAVREVSVVEVKKLLDANAGVVLLDVRDKHEFEDGHIPGAVNVSRGTLEFKASLQFPDKNARIVVHCGQDLRSPLATRALNDLGYRNAVNMVGGLKAWKEAGYPVVK